MPYDDRVEPPPLRDLERRAQHHDCVCDIPIVGHAQVRDPCVPDLRVERQVPRAEQHVDRIVLSACIEPITARECVDIEVEFTLDSVAVRQQVGLSLEAHVVVVGMEDKAVIADNAKLHERAFDVVDQVAEALVEVRCLLTHADRPVDACGPEIRRQLDLQALLVRRWRSRCWRGQSYNAQRLQDNQLDPVQDARQ